MRFSTLGCAEERLVTGEQTLHHGDADGVRERKAGQRGGQSLPQVGADLRRIQMHQLG